MQPNTAQPDKVQPRSQRRKFFIALAVVLNGLLLLGGVVVWKTMFAMPGTSFRGELPVEETTLAVAEGATPSPPSLVDRLREDVAMLADMGEKHLQLPKALAKAADAIESSFQAAGYVVQRQTFEVSGQECSNLEVEILGSQSPEEIVIVGAHYDTADGTPGANDNGSGVAATLALARRFAREKPARTLRFVAFTNEEPPYFQTDAMGSRVYARRCKQRGEKVVAMLSLETIGYYDDREGSQRYPQPLAMLYPSTGNFIGFIGNAASADLVHRVVATFRKKEAFPSEGAALPAAVNGVGFSDHWSFFEEGYPALMVTDTAMMRYPYYHRAEDTVDKIDFDRMARVVHGLEAVVAELCGVDARE